MKKVLIIEDDPNVRDNIHDILSLESIYTVMASNGSEGLLLAKEELPDLIVCDIMLPELSGYEILAALRQEVSTQAIPFIFLTAKAERSDLRQGMTLGADDYLTKPFTPEELRQTIAARLARQESQEQKAQRKLDELRSTIAQSLPHELNTPLVGIINGARFLRTCYGTLETKEIMDLLDCMERSGNRLYTLIQNFITYADLELLAANPEDAAKLKSGEATCFPSYMIRVVALNKAREARRELDLQLDLQEAFVNISEWRFKKVVEEVIDNAFKFSHPGTPVKVVSSVKDDWFHLFVIDHGRGMEADQISAIGAYMQFQRKLFEQQGTGLGLAIAKRTLDLYGGELTIESFLDQQTIVRITLPTTQWGSPANPT